MTAKEYLLDIGFDEAHLPELFNNDDKSYYQIAELMESYHQSKVENLGLFGVINCPYCGSDNTEKSITNKRNRFCQNCDKYY